MNHEPWHADIHITDALVKKCIEAQFPALAPITDLECIGEGWDNKAYLINKKTIFRFPRRSVAVELIERENKVLDALLKILDTELEIPEPIFYGVPTPEYPYPFQGYTMIPGISGCHANLTEQERRASLAPLAHFLKQLHSIKETEAREIGAKSSIFDRSDVHYIANMILERIDKIIDLKICHLNAAMLKDEVKKAYEIKLPNNNCLIHGDLYCRHLMFNQGKLTGIIDWGDVAINNPAIDLAAIWGFYPKDCHKEFLQIYGDVDTNIWQYARFLEFHGALAVMLYGYDIGDTLLVKESIDSLKRVDPNLVFE